MSIFFRLLKDEDKTTSLIGLCQDLRVGKSDKRIFEVLPEVFDLIPGSPFSYWISDHVRNLYKSSNIEDYEFKQGIATADDFRFLRSWWEINAIGGGWLPIAKGGPYSPWYQDLDLVVEWKRDGEQIRTFPKSRPQNIQYFRRPGITWPFRTQKGLNTRALPGGSAFTIQGMGGFHHELSPDETLILLGLTNSEPFKKLLLISVGFFAFQTGAMASVPRPQISEKERIRLISMAKQAWSLTRKLDADDESSHAFILPRALLEKIYSIEQCSIVDQLKEIQNAVNDLVFSIYGLNESDRAEILNYEIVLDESPELISEDEQDAELIQADDSASLLSWALGVAFGRLDWRLATGERVAAAEPEPFDPLPAKSPGMLPDLAEPFHAHAGILVDDQGHPHDLSRLVEEVLNRVDVSVPDDVRRWLRKDFFAFHLQCYSKSRRKAPIYWPLSTASGSYTLWVYYPSLNNQTLFTAVNDFLDGPNGKLTQVSRECAELRIKGSGRSRDEEKQYETLQTFEQELTDLRDTLLRIAPSYQPNHDDGVQITAAPLWPLFRHKPWQKVLKDTWTKLEKGNYDWAHLAMAYWPERVREKCKADKSLAITHGLEDLYVEPEAAPKKTRGKKKEL